MPCLSHLFQEERGTPTPKQTRLPGLCAIVPARPLRAEIPQPCQVWKGLQRLSTLLGKVSTHQAPLLPQAPAAQSTNPWRDATRRACLHPKPSPAPIAPRVSPSASVAHPCTTAGTCRHAGAFVAVVHEAGEGVLPPPSSLRSGCASRAVSGGEVFGREIFGREIFKHEVLKSEIFEREVFRGAPQPPAGGQSAGTNLSEAAGKAPCLGPCSAAPICPPGP